MLLTIKILDILNVPDISRIPIASLFWTDYYYLCRTVSLFPLAVQQSSPATGITEVVSRTLKILYCTSRHY